MANYTKATDFQAKDALLTGNPAKIIKGSEINDEFNAIQTAVATKADLASPAFTGTPTAATQSFGNSSTRLATTAFVQAALQALYPIGTIYTAIVSTNPNTLFGFGTWVAFATGKTIIGVDSGNTAFDTVEESGGSADSVVVAHTHTGTTASNGGHIHGVYGSSTVPDLKGLKESSARTVAASNSTSSAGYTETIGNTATNVLDTGGAHTHTITTDSTGVTGTNANLPPYITVYMWKRTA